MISHETRFGPWLYTCISTGRLLTHATAPLAESKDVRYYVNTDCVRDAEGAERAIGHVERKPWVTPADVSELRRALEALGKMKAPGKKRAA